MPLTVTQQFGIFSDVLGLKEDMPSVKLAEVFSPESENVFLHNGELKRMPGRLAEIFNSSNAQIPVTDGYPVIRYHQHFDTTGTEFLFLFTKAHIYKWNTSTKAYDAMFTCASNCDMWESVSFKGYVIATNWVDKVIYWNDATPGTAFAVLDTASGLSIDGAATYLTKAKYITTYKDYVILGYTLEGGVTYPRRIRWCSLRDETDWQSVGGSGDAGYKDFNEGSDHIKGFGKYTAYRTDYLIVFKAKSHYLGTTVITDEVFTFAAPQPVGLLATHSVVNDRDGRCFYIGHDYNIREIGEGIITHNLDDTMNNICPTYEGLIESTFINKYNMICWSIPGSASSTTLDKLIRYNLTAKTFEIDSFSVRAFGYWTRQASYTIDTYPGTYDGAVDIIDAVAAIAGFPVDMCGDTSGYSWSFANSTLDKGASYTSKLVLSTDLTPQRQGLKMFKRLWSMQFWLRRQTTGSLNIYIKRDNELNWLSLGTVDMTDSAEPEFIVKDFPCDGRARHFLIKIESTVAFSFLGMIFDFVFDGER